MSDAGGNGRDSAGALQAQNARGTGRRVVVALALQEICSIDGCCRDIDQHFTGIQFRRCDLDPVHRLWPTLAAVDLNCIHRHQ